MFAPPPNSIVDDDGRILPEVLAARRRGVWFDLGNGRTGHLRWDIVERVMQAGFWPDTFSTDWTPRSRTAQVIDFPNVMSKFLDFGMPLDQVIARATVNASRVFEVFRDRGTLNVGAPADVAVLELREGSFEFVDNYENKRTGRQRLFPSGTVLGGKRVPRAWTLGGGALRVSEDAGPRRTGFRQMNWRSPMTRIVPVVLGVLAVSTSALAQTTRKSSIAPWPPRHAICVRLRPSSSGNPTTPTRR